MKSVTRPDHHSPVHAPSLMSRRYVVDAWLDLGLGNLSGLL